EGTRSAKAKRMSDISTKASGDSRSMDTGEAEEFDTLNDECKALAKDTGRLHDLEEIEKATALPVAGAAAEKAAAPARQNGGSLQIKTTEKLEPGIGFARYAMCLGKAKGDHAKAFRL